jgi:aromatic ring-cleaving dioxygenase
MFCDVIYVGVIVGHRPFEQVDPGNDRQVSGHVSQSNDGIVADTNQHDDPKSKSKINDQGRKTAIMILCTLFFLLLVFNGHAWIPSRTSSATRISHLLAHGDDLKKTPSASLGYSYTLKPRNPYDVHVYYDTPEQFQQALKLREEMKVVFPWMRFYNPKSTPIGPHPVPMWEADFGSYENRDQLEGVCQFLQQHHDQLSIMIHPHSTDGDYADHTEHIIWFGSALKLRIDGWRRE